MLTRDFALKFKSAPSEEGAFTGLAAVYGERDLVDDVIEPGAFRNSVQSQGKGFPLLWSHRQDEPIGIAVVADDKAGLVVHGQLLMEDPAAQRAYSHMKAGTVKGLSIGYTLPRGKVQYRDDGVRLLREVYVHEVSVVAVPAAPRAQISSVKALGDVRHVLKALRDVDEDMLAELLEVDRELRRLLAGNDPQEQKAQQVAQLQAFAAELKRI